MELQMQINALLNDINSSLSLISYIHHGCPFKTVTVKEKNGLFDVSIGQGLYAPNEVIYYLRRHAEELQRVLWKWIDGNYG